KSRYKMQINYKNKVCISYYNNEIEAALKYNEKALELYGDKARINIII
ncbi:unnamed protein product, partial [marine sediment metagenome]